MFSLKCCASVSFIILVFISQSNSARLLGFFPAPSYSHQVVYRAYMQELAKNGHNVTIITPNPAGISNPNYHEIAVPSVFEKQQKATPISSDGEWLLRNVPEFFLYILTKYSTSWCEDFFSDPNVNRIIKDKEQFDAFVMESGLSQCAMPFSLQSKNITIGIFSTGFGNPAHFSMGSTSNFAHIPETLLPFSDHMTLLQRFRTLIYVATSVILTPLMYSEHQEVANKYFGPDTPPLSELVKTINLHLPNSHVSTSYPRPHATNVIPFGGTPVHLHNYQAKPLPLDLQEFLDDAPDGVIYFSLGSNVKSSTMPEEKRAQFLNAFRQIKQKVLWKWETDDLPGKPDNVKVQKWLPQSDVLAHPNIKAFITQGGLQSLGEATHFEIPLVVIPFYGDQDLNAKKMEMVGVAVKLVYSTLTSKDLVSAINEVVNNPKYKENMVKYSAMTRDQPQSPMERAVWWTEYVLRHNGAPHLRSAAVDMPFYEYFMLDVIGFLLAVVGCWLYASYYIISRILRRLFGKNKTKKD